MENNKNNGKSMSFESLDILISRWKDGTFSEIIDDWKWIFSYSARYKGAIVFYVFLGILSTSLGLVSSVASKYMIDIITGYKTSKLSYDRNHGGKCVVQPCVRQCDQQGIY